MERMKSCFVLLERLTSEKCSQLDGSSTFSSPKGSTQVLRSVNKCNLLSESSTNLVVGISDKHLITLQKEGKSSPSSLHPRFAEARCEMCNKNLAISDNTSQENVSKTCSSCDSMISNLQLLCFSNEKNNNSDKEGLVACKLEPCHTLPYDSEDQNSEYDQYQHTHLHKSNVDTSHYEQKHCPSTLVSVEIKPCFSKEYINKSPEKTRNSCSSIKMEPLNYITEVKVEIPDADFANGLETCVKTENFGLFVSDNLTVGNQSINNYSRDHFPPVLSPTCIREISNEMETCVKTEPLEIIDVSDNLSENDESINTCSRVSPSQMPSPVFIGEKDEVETLNPIFSCKTESCMSVSYNEVVSSSESKLDNYVIVKNTHKGKRQKRKKIVPTTLIYENMVQKQRKDVLPYVLNPISSNKTQGEGDTPISSRLRERKQMQYRYSVSNSDTESSISDYENEKGNSSEFGSSEMENSSESDSTLLKKKCQAVVPPPMCNNINNSNTASNSTLMPIHNSNNKWTTTTPIIGQIIPTPLILKELQYSSNQEAQIVLSENVLPEDAANSRAPLMPTLAVSQVKCFPTVRDAILDHYYQRTQSSLSRVTPHSKIITYSKMERINQHEVTTTPPSFLCNGSLPIKVSSTLNEEQCNVTTKTNSINENGGNSNLSNRRGDLKTPINIRILNHFRPSNNSPTLNLERDLDSNNRSDRAPKLILEKSSTCCVTTVNSDKDSKMSSGCLVGLVNSDNIDVDENPNIKKTRTRSRKQVISFRTESCSDSVHDLSSTDESLLSAVYCESHMPSNKASEIILEDSTTCFVSTANSDKDDCAVSFLGVVNCENMASDKDTISRRTRKIPRKLSCGSVTETCAESDYEASTLKRQHSKSPISFSSKPKITTHMLKPYKKENETESKYVQNIPSNVRKVPRKELNLSSSETDTCAEYDYELCSTDEKESSTLKRLDCTSSSPFSSKPKITTHMSKHYNNSSITENNPVKNIPSNSLKCVHCDECFSNEILLIKHLYSAHVKNVPEDKSWKCDVCQKVIKYRNMKDHLWLHSVTKSFICKICNQTFGTSGAMCAHKLMHAVEGEDLPVSNSHPMCSVCLSFFSSLIDLENHNCVTNFRKCRFCPNILKDKYHYDLQVRSHFPQGITRIFNSEKSFSQKDSLSTQDSVRHQFERSFKCKTCHREFMNEDFFVKHICKKTVQCQVCTITVTRRGLLRHLHGLPSVCVLKCDICDTRFRSKTNLLSRGSKYRTDLCQFCAKEFKSQVGLNQDISQSNFLIDTPQPKKESSSSKEEITSGHEPIPIPEFPSIVCNGISPQNGALTLNKEQSIISKQNRITDICSGQSNWLTKRIGNLYAPQNSFILNHCSSLNNGPISGFKSNTHSDTTPSSRLKNSSTCCVTIGTEITKNVSAESLVGLVNCHSKASNEDPVAKRTRKRPRKMYFKPESETCTDSDYGPSLAIKKKMSIFKTESNSVPNIPSNVRKSSR